jgi:hypothetical protein
MGLRKDKGDSGTVAQEIQPAGEVSPCLFANVDVLPPPPVSSTGQALTPPTKGGGSRSMTDNSLPLDGGGEVGVKGHHTSRHKQEFNKAHT